MVSNETELLTTDDIIELLKIMEQFDFDELEVHTDKIELIIRKRVADSSTRISAKSTAKGLEQPGHETQIPGKADCIETCKPSEKTNGAEDALYPEEHFVKILAPTMGTFYRAKSPGEPPFVEVGQSVAEDDIVCIIEVMKVMNSVSSGVKGRVVKILVQNGELVEYQQPLIVISPE